MITPSFGLTATERVLPKLALDFTTATLDPRVTFTRSGNTATYTNSSGVITAINANLPRFDYNPTTLVCQGLLIEEARTNLLLNSLIDGTSLTTQSVTVAATTYTLSFYGTGSINLSGTHTATVTGTGAYPSRKTYTFTSTAGTLTLTVTGTVQYAQLEAGAFATSYIPTTTTALTRNADVATMTGTNFSDWYNQPEGTLWTDFISGPIVSGNRVIVMSGGGSGNRVIDANYTSSTALAVYDGTGNLNLSSSMAANTEYKMSVAYKTNDYMGVVNNGSLFGRADATVNTANALYIGAYSSGTLQTNGWIKKINYYPLRLTDAQLQALSHI